MLSKDKTIAIAVTTVALSLGGIGIAFAENSSPESRVDGSYALDMTMSRNMTDSNMTGNMTGNMGSDMESHMDGDMDSHMDGDMDDHMDGDMDDHMDGDMDDHMDEENSL